MLPLSPLLFLSTSRKQRSRINSLVNKCLGEEGELALCGDLLEGLWTVLFGHPLPLDMRGGRKAPRGAPQRGAAAKGVDIGVRRHLLLDNTRSHCRKGQRSEHMDTKNFPFFNFTGGNRVKLAIDQQLEGAPVLLLSNLIDQNHRIIPSIRFCDSVDDKGVDFLPESVIVLQRLAIF